MKNYTLGNSQSFFPYGITCEGVKLSETATHNFQGAPLLGKEII